MRAICSRVLLSWKNFAEHTTLGGLGHSFHAKNWISKLAWILTFTFLGGSTIWNTFYVVHDYLSYPVVTRVKIKYESEVPFPSVTVCNRNPIQCTKLALAYLENEGTLKELMALSGCSKTVTRPPLIYRVTNSFFPNLNLIRSFNILLAENCVLSLTTCSIGLHINLNRS